MKKNKYTFILNRSVLLFFASCILLFATSCNFPDVSGPEPDPPNPPGPDPDPPADTAGTLAPDGVLETVTWNLEWYGSDFSGPDDFDLQTANIVEVVDSLKADLYAFEEVNKQKSLDNIVEKMKGYRGFVADYISQSQQMGFVYNTNTIDSLEAGPINIVSDYSNSDWNYYWAGQRSSNSTTGRLPLYFRFNYHYEGTTIEFYAIAIHAISNYGDDTDEDYARRTKAVNGLYNYLRKNKPGAKIIMLGDYNDDVDVSIYDNISPSPYEPFVNDSNNFKIVTKSLSDNKMSSTVGYSDTIDHITISDEVYTYYINSSVTVFKKAEDFIEKYETTTSDHYPVMAKFDIR